MKNLMSIYYCSCHLKSKRYPKARVVGRAALASMMGAMTGMKTTAFNSAGVHPLTKFFARTQSGGYYNEGVVENVILRNDILNIAQDYLPFILPDPVGKREYFNPADPLTFSWEQHSSSTMMEGILARKRQKNTKR